MSFGFRCNRFIQNLFINDSFFLEIVGTPTAFLVFSDIFIIKISYKYSILKNWIKYFYPTAGPSVVLPGHRHLQHIVKPHWPVLEPKLFKELQKLPHAKQPKAILHNGTLLGTTHGQE